MLVSRPSIQTIDKRLRTKVIFHPLTMILS